MYYINKNAFAFRVGDKDAKRYINARITNDINLLENEDSISAAILDSRGKTQGYFEIFKQGEEYLFISEGGEAKNIVEAFKQFIVADRVSLSPENIKLVNVIGACEKLSEFSLKYQVNEIKTFILLEKNNLETFLVELKKDNHKELNKEEYNYRRIDNNKLSFEEELENIFFPEAEIINSYSTNKGCYTGQEAVEMVLARGKLPAILKYCIVNGKIEVSKKTKVFEDKDNNKQIGSVLNFAFSNQEQKTALLLRLRKTPAEVFIEHVDVPIKMI